jgi:outer membrane lipoprotein-sorting protein
MIARAALRLLVVTAAAGVVSEAALAQAIPVPLPRPASLTVRASTPSTPRALAPAQTTTPAASGLTIEGLAASRAAAEAQPQGAPVAQPVSLVEQPAQAAPIEVGPPPGARLAAVRTPTAAAAPTSPGSALNKVNTYFNGIRTLVGNFSQVAPDGSRTSGKFFLSKPGRVRFYYQAPSTTDIIADGKSVVVRDRKLATQDVYPLAQTPLKFLLDPNLDLTRDSKVTGVREEGGRVSVAMEQDTTFGGKSRVLLVFGSDNADGFELKQWTITDPQGLDTTVMVSDLDSRSKPDDKLFKVDYTRYVR